MKITVTPKEFSRLKLAHKVLGEILDSGLIDRLDAEERKKRGDEAELSYISTAHEELADLLNRFRGL